MPTIPGPLQGAQLSRTSADLVFAGVRTAAWKGLSYKTTLKTSKSWGSSALPISRTRGKADFEGDFEVHTEDWYAFLLPAIASLNPAQGYMQNEFDVAVTYFEASNGLGTLCNVLLAGCRISEDGDAVKDNDDGLTVTVKLDPMRIYRNGLLCVQDNIAKPI